MSTPRSLPPGTLSEHHELLDERATTLVEYLSAIADFEIGPEFPDAALNFVCSHVSTAADAMRESAEKVGDTTSTVAMPGWHHLMDLVPLVCFTLDAIAMHHDVIAKRGRIHSWNVHLVVISPR